MIVNQGNKQRLAKVDISIIIVNYKSWIHLRACLNSILDLPEQEFYFEIIVVDNQSNDSRLDNFTKEFPKVDFFTNSGNYGFSSGCNFGVSKSNGEFLLFLNPDTIVSKSTISTLFSMARTNSDFGIVSCSKINIHGKLENEIRYFPNFYTLFGFSRAIRDIISKKIIASEFNDSKKIIFPNWVSGSIMFTSREWFQRVNGFNEDYWLYLEDVDFCKKIQNAGGEIVLTRATNIIHNHGGASRINVKTAALTKAEVIISKHTYINSHFGKGSSILSHSLLILYTLTVRSIIGLLGLILFFVPKMYVQFLIYKNVILYYINALYNLTWISPRAPNHQNSML